MAERLRLLLPPLIAALLSQGLLVGLLRPLLAPRSPVAATPVRDDTPELLRLSEQLQAQPGEGFSITQPITLPPPPPPPPDLRSATTGRAKPRSTSPRAQLGKARPPGVPRAATTTAAAKVRQPAVRRQPPGRPQSAPPPASTSAGAAPSGPAGLPRLPGPALELALAIAEGAASSLPNDGVTQAMAAQQRRQLWLDPAQQRLLQRAWERAASEQPPADWGDLPEGTQVRRAGLGSLGPLAAGDVRARSLVSRQQITLLWPQGSQLWLLRLPLAAAERS